MRLLFCIGSILIRHDVRLVGAVLADDFFHPDHVVPAPELIAAVVEGTGQREAQMLVELGAVFGEVFVLRLRVADAGVEVEDTHGLEPVGQRLIEGAAQSAAPGVVVEVDGQLCGPVVGRAAYKSVGIGVALDAYIASDISDHFL